MKRSAALKSLSQDHHLALVLGKRCVEAAASGCKENITDVYEKLRDSNYFNELETHFRAEEQELFPRMVNAGEVALIEKALQDHHELRRLMQRITAEKEAGDIGAFGNCLIAHVRFEERELFCIAEKVLHLNS